MDNENKKGSKFLMELADLLQSAAFPFMLMVIFGSTIISYAVYCGEDLPIQIIILVAGEAFLVAATVIFGKQNGVSAYRKTVQNTNKRKINSTDIRSVLYIGEYAPYKGAIIGLIVCVPFAIFELIYAIVPNDVCEFVLMYVFGWAHYPFKLANLSPWLNFIWIIPYVAVHTIAYVWGGLTEKKKQDTLAEADKNTAKHSGK